ncbi:hypothetical protein FALBO_7618 [Fusarium albosuccineum]|uniref:Uncharacterized protein n=1 Tax=Fusarium albosuccineum TaxID=1237068 RepID=A0A8H4LDH7_9HYPO|nr:hypothetical protein FALBO_7618 [Fusarium albosuccineum]
MGEWRFEIIQNITTERELLGTIILPDWQMWQEAYFKRVSDTLADPKHTAKLMQNGCDNGDSGEPNCIRTCNSTENMFRTPQNLWNCMTLSTVAMKVVPEPRIDTVNEDSEKEMGEMFQFHSLKDFDQLYAFRKVRRCLWQSCSDSKYGSCTEGLLDYQCSPIHQFNVDAFGKILSENYCQDADPGFDFDLVGQGVLISYIMQNVLVFFFVFSFALTSRWTRVHIWGGIGRLFSKSSSSPLATRIKEISHPRKWFLRFGLQFPSAITSTLVDLQEAQALFTATISIATIVAFHGYTGLANIVSISSYVLNSEIARGVIVIGMGPLLLMQLALHASGSPSTYTLAFVLLNWVFILAKFILHKDGAAGYEKVLGSVSTVSACGDNPGAMSYCMNYDMEKVFSYSTPSFILVHVVTFFLLLDGAVHRYTAEQFIQKTGSRWTRTLSRFLSPMRYLAIPTAILAITVMSLGLADLVLLYKDLHGRYAAEGGLPWSFGQLTAVAVWFPVVFKFLYYCGVKDGVQARIDKAEYVVSRRETAISEFEGSKETASENDRLMGPADLKNPAGMELVETRASEDTSSEGLFKGSRTRLESDIGTP